MQCSKLLQGTVKPMFVGSKVEYKCENYAAEKMAVFFKDTFLRYLFCLLLNEHVFACIIVFYDDFFEKTRCVKKSCVLNVTLIMFFCSLNL